MSDNLHINADRFSGFADVYESVRPQMPRYAIETVKRYLGKNPDVVVDLGCGTGLSTLVWVGTSDRIIGVDPSLDMISIAREKAKNIQSVEFMQGFADSTNLADACTDAVICSQSFHWMEPQSTLREVNRILKPNGIFLTLDCDWPPVCNLEAEVEYNKLFDLVEEKEATDPSIRSTFRKWAKEKHLSNIKNSGYFAYAREIVFANRELCTAGRFIGLARSQGSLQSVLKRAPEVVSLPLKEFETAIKDIFGQYKLEIDFCYRMRIGIK